VIATPLLVRWYGTLAVVAAVLATKAIVIPPWPAAPPPLPRQALEANLRREGLLPPSDLITTLPGWPAQRGYELSTSAPVVIPLRDGLELTLMAGSVRQRFNLQAAFIGRDQPGLKLDERREVPAQPPTAKGLVQGRGTFQTCLVRGSGLVEAFGVTRDQLAPLTDQMALGGVALLERLAGLQPNRAYGCTLISLRAPRRHPPPEQTWNQVLRTLEPELRSPE
jgi:hypothetical protein